MTIPDFQSLMLPILQRAEAGEINNKSAVEAATATFALGPEDLAKLLPGGGQTIIANRAAWAMIYLQRAGLLERKRRGVYEITSRGREVLSGKPQRIDLQLLRIYPEFHEFISSGHRKDDDATTSEPIDADENRVAATPLERLDEAHRTLTSALRVEVLDRILAASPAFFEKAVIKLLTAMGYGGTVEEAAQHLGGAGDGGVDGVIRLDALGIDKVYIQAKRYARDARVGRPDVQAFSGSLDDKQTTRGVFITTSSFTAEALSYAKSIPKQIVLIDGDRLSELMVRYGVGVRMDRAIEVKRLDDDFFEE